MENKAYKRMKYLLKDNKSAIILAALEFGISFVCYIVSFVFFCKGYIEHSVPLYGFVLTLILFSIFSACFSYEIINLIKLIKKRREIKYKLYLIEMELTHAYTLDEDE